MKIIYINQKKIYYEKNASKGSDNKKIHFGFTMGINNMDFKIKQIANISDFANHSRGNLKEIKISRRLNLKSKAIKFNPMWRTTIIIIVVERKKVT